MNSFRRFGLAFLLVLAALPARAGAPAHNVVIFVADGLRYESVTRQTAPTMFALKERGVDFTNSHALYPTLTTANASAIATGHYLGDTGDYANVLYTGFPVAAKENSPVVFLEDDSILKEVKAHFGDGYLGPQSLLAAARAGGMGTAAIGKAGPAAIQDISALAGQTTFMLDDTMQIYPDPQLAAETKAATGMDGAPATSTPNVAQQTYLVTAATQIVLPALKAKSKPFVLVFWSRDPDATQHVSPDSVGNLVPGINGDISKAGIANADNNLHAILDSLAKLGLTGTTDVFVTADHGFSTVAKGDADGKGGAGAPSHPSGFLAIDIANWLGKKLFDPDRNSSELDIADGEHPARGDAIIGDSAASPDAIIAANGGSDLIYAPDAARAKAIYAHLIQQAYTGALFVNDALLKDNAKDFAGALPMSAIGLIGAADVPQPAIVVGFASFVVKACKASVRLCAAEMADTSLQTGQGMHGSFSRADTRNFMAAAGPDFKTRFADSAPVSNADIAPTIAHILHLTMTGKGTLTGRIAGEALKGGKRVSVMHGWQAAQPGAGGLKTVLEYQQVGGARYFDAGGIVGRTVGLSAH